MNTSVEVSHYELNDNNRITSKGKFEGCQRWVPHFWDYVMNGESDFTDEDYDYVDILPQDTAEFPELLEYAQVRLHECVHTGFIYVALTKTKFNYDEN